MQVSLVNDGPCTIELKSEVALAPTAAPRPRLPLPALSLVHVNGIVGRNQLRHLQMVHCLHRNRHISDGCINRFFGSRLQLPVFRMILVITHRREIVLLIPLQAFPQSLSAVQNADFGPEVHQPVGSRRARQADDPLCLSAEAVDCPRPLGAVVFKAGEFIQNDSIEQINRPLLGDQPLHVVTIRDINLSIRFQRCPPLLRGAEDNRNLQSVQVTPFSCLHRPNVSRHPKRRYHQHFADLAFLQQILQGGQANHRLPESAIQKSSCCRMGFDKINCIFLIFMRNKLHIVSP